MDSHNLNRLIFRRPFMYLGSSAQFRYKDRRAPWIFLLLLFSFTPVLTFAQDAATEKKINDTIAKMTLEEKITMLSGSSMMASAPIPRLGVPALRMSDGPV